MKFTKMHGCGNDYVYVNCFEEQIRDPAALSVKISDRHFSVGSDGLILIGPSDIADFSMDIYNADGSRAMMCGNGIRCVGKYVYDKGLTDHTRITVETRSGIKTLELKTENGKVNRVLVDMGSPILEPSLIPMKSGLEKVIGEPVQAAGREWTMTCLSMGNPHCVVPVETVNDLKLEEIGPAFEWLDIFPERVNTEFIHVDSQDHVTMRVWERGSGETFACGTGACAAAVACMLNGWTGDQVTVSLRGGDLQITWDRLKNTVFMEGEAVISFEGCIETED